MRSSAMTGPWPGPLWHCVFTVLAVAAVMGTGNEQVTAYSQFDTGTAIPKLLTFGGFPGVFAMPGLLKS